MALRGSLADIGPADLIQLNCQTGGKAKLTVRQDGTEAVFYFDRGEIVHAVCGGAEGAEAVYEFLSWEKGVFEVEQKVDAPVHTIDISWSALMMEGLRRLDERRHKETEGGKEINDMETKTRKERLEETLRRIVEESADIRGVAVVSKDGLIVSAALPSEMELARVGAVAAGIMGLSDRSVRQLDCGGLARTMIQGEDGNVVLVNAGPNVFLIAMTGQDVNLGLVFLEVAEGAKAVASILAQ